jgi:predicted transcriptional regulator
MTALQEHRAMLARRLRHPPSPATIKVEATVLISIKPHYARLIESGQKRVEFRRRFPKELIGGRAIFYVSSPARRIELTARITTVHRAAPRELWREFAAIGGTMRGDFDAYFSDAREGVALVLDEVQALRPAIALDDQRLKKMDFRPPQSLTVLPSTSPLFSLLLNSFASSHHAPGLRA